MSIAVTRGLEMILCSCTEESAFGESETWNVQTPILTVHSRCLVLRHTRSRLTELSKLKPGCILICLRIQRNRAKGSSSFLSFLTHPTSWCGAIITEVLYDIARLQIALPRHWYVCTVTYYDINVPWSFDALHSNFFDSWEDRDTRDDSVPGDLPDWDLEIRSIISEAFQLNHEGSVLRSHLVRSEVTSTWNQGNDQVAMYLLLMYMVYLPSLSTLL